MKPKSEHVRFLLSNFRENLENFVDLRICCSDGVVRQNRIFFGLILDFLRHLPEFSSPDIDPVVILPDYTVEHYSTLLNDSFFDNGYMLDIDNELIDVNCIDDVLLTTDQTDEIHVNNSLGQLFSFEEEKESSEHNKINITINDELTEDNLDKEAIEIDICSVCQIRVKKTAMYHHIAAHNKPHKCPDCDKKFARVKTLIAHRQNIHKTSGLELEAGLKPLHSCTFCTAVFENPNQLMKHGYSHTKEKPHGCDVCGKRFVSRSNLRAHQRLHEGTALRYSCDQCDKRFSHPSEVKQHRVVHTGVRGYWCDACGASYSRYPSLWKHKRKCPGGGIVLVQPLSENLVTDGSVILSNI